MQRAGIPQLESQLAGPSDGRQEISSRQQHRFAPPVHAGSKQVTLLLETQASLLGSLKGPGRPARTTISTDTAADSMPEALLVPAVPRRRSSRQPL
ncbi:hypothetical protein EYF80_008410 [Liparis tanakae]|uniref:Uncharacterized protein n=1 Tax=Liparis tanakae TaxID=230148 RepID=A0A4Z2IV06_9TELE|nr:hypothetical protein EYF80_008410 [Liparis tanakae]